MCCSPGGVPPTIWVETEKFVTSSGEKAVNCCCHPRARLGVRSTWFFCGPFRASRESIYRVEKELVASSQPCLGCAILAATSCLSPFQLRAQFGDVLGICTTQSGKYLSPSTSPWAVVESLTVGFSQRFALVSLSHSHPFIPPSPLTFFSLSFILFHNQTHKNSTRPINQVLCFRYLHPSPFLVQCRKPCLGCKRAFPPLFFPFPRRFYLTSVPLPLLSLVSHL